MSFWIELLGAQVRYTGNKYKTRMIEMGQGEPLILLHGNGGHVESFINNIPYLSKHFRTIAIDFLWHGYSSTPPFQPAIIPSFMDQVLDVMDAEGIETAYVAAQSMGAWPAMELAISHPHRVKKLVLTTPQGFLLDEANRATQKERLLVLREKTLQALHEPSLDNIRIRLERLVVNKELITDEMVKVRHQLYNDPEINKFQKLFAEAYLGGDESEMHLITKERLASILCPTLVYWSENNPVPPVVGEKLARSIPNAEYHCVSNTGHWAQYENFEEYNGVITRFLQK